MVFLIIEGEFALIKTREEGVFALKVVAFLDFHDFSVFQAYFVREFAYFTMRVPHTVNNNG